MIRALLCLALAAAATQAPVVHVNVVSHSHTPASEAVLRLQSAEGTRTVQVRLGEGRGRAAVQNVALPLHVTAAAPGFWAAETTVEEPGAEAVDVDLWPASTVSASVAPPRGVAPKASLVRLRLMPAGSGSTPADLQPGEAEITCALAQVHMTPCAVPAGLWNIRALVPGFVPRYLWGVRLVAGKNAGLGTIRLRTGASVFGKVVAEVGRVDPKTAQVDMAPAIDRTGETQHRAERIEQLTWTVSVNGEGYFQAAGVPPGRYNLTARQPGFMPSAPASILVEANAELQLQKPLRLREASIVDVSVTPPEGPQAVRWGVRLYEVGRLKDLKQVASGRGRDGRWTSPPVAPGRYAVQVLDAADSSMAWSRVELVAGRQSVDVSLDLVIAEGRVTLDDEPVAGTLWFGGRAGSVSVESTSDDQGRFSVVLPHDGRWKVDLMAEDGKAAARGIATEVKRGPDGYDHDVVIELPNTSIKGEVVDEDGRPVAGAWVNVLTLGGPGVIGAVKSDSQGWFELNGEQEGTYQVEAQDSGRRSRRETVSVAEDVTPAPLRLVLNESWVLQGAVNFRGTPVPGAVLMAYPFSAQGQLATLMIPRGRTGMDGGFVLDLPGGATTARVVVMAPGFVFHVQSARRRSDHDSDWLDVALSQDGGTLRLTRIGSREEDAAQAGRGVVLVWVDGEPIDQPLLINWAAMNGVTGEPGDLRVPALPAGSYMACWLTPQEALQVMGGLALPSGDTCASGALSPKGTLDLVLPTP